MASIIKTTQRITSAKAFHSQIDAGTVYVGLGRTAEWTDEQSPPPPTDALDDDTDFWTNLIGVAKVDVSDTSMTVPRVNWTSGDSYQVFDSASIDAYNEPFYVINTRSQVFECTTVGGGTVSEEPELTGTLIEGTEVATTDGYVWTFLFELSTNDTNEILTNDWMPCYPTFEEKLGAHIVMIRRLIPDSVGTDNKIGLVSYRQTAILLDVQAQAGGAFIDAYGAKADLETNLSPGVLIQLDNRKAINRNTDQTETLISLIKF
jgi:hypothetical protein